VVAGGAHVLAWVGGVGDEVGDPLVGVQVLDWRVERLALGNEAVQRRGTHM